MTGAFVPNGCGGQGSIIDPPDLRFTSACNEHDLAYEFGGGAADRRDADRALLQGMLLRSEEAPWYERPILYPAAWLYFGVVRVFGGRYWKRGKKFPHPDKVARASQ